MNGDKIEISYETLWKAIIRPPKNEYNEMHLGEKEFSYHSKNYVRNDYNLLSKRGFIMKCSFIELNFQEREK